MVYYLVRMISSWDEEFANAANAVCSLFTFSYTNPKLRSFAVKELLIVRAFQILYNTLAPSVERNIISLHSFAKKCIGNRAISRVLC